MEVDSRNHLFAPGLSPGWVSLGGDLGRRVRGGGADAGGRGRHVEEDDHVPEFARRLEKRS